MTNVLQLFWQPGQVIQQQKEASLPVPKKTKKRKFETTTEPDTDCKTVNYVCLKCGKQSEFGPSTDIQCPKCNYRVLEKIRGTKQITYNAV